MQVYLLVFSCIYVYTFVLFTCSCTNLMYFCVFVYGMVWYGMGSVIPYVLQQGFRWIWSGRSYPYTRESGTTRRAENLRIWESETGAAWAFLGLVRVKGCLGSPGSC